ncbi:TMV resistance protein N-like [Trifolium pratense]|uniref:TMV resistance protein N-like n=1 Tax=Trifolium pratense TaxID=57577 RepID=UPI001E695AEF|nr:TMV resistance protein N-like [Trifolium pratense]
MANYEETSSNFTHDVFLISSPNGNSKTFTDYIYQALLDSKITTVRYSSDEDITTTMEKCRISMVVLCENYAYSTKCLDELVKIIDSYDTKRKEVCVIFYKVEPSDVWFQKNCYERSLIEHEKSLGRDSETVKGWRMALSRICDLGGQHCKEDKYESGYLRKIVKDTSAKLPPPVPSEIKHPIGLDSRFEQLKSLIDIEPNNPVCMLGIYGEAGIGKTTLASYLYNKIRHQFEVASFLTNIREKSNNNNIIDLKDLQRTLLYETVKETQTVVETTFEGHSQIKDKLRHKRVLLILDDVNSIEQLKALAGGCDWFGSGSRIITTRVEIETELDKHHAIVLGNIK